MDKCALCQHFGMKAYPKFAALGMGRCAKAPAATFCRWDATACSEYEPARDMEARVKWVSKTKGDGK